MRRRRTKRRGAVVILFGAVSVWSGGSQAQSFIFAEDYPPASLNPAHRRTMVETRLAELLFLGLFRDERSLEPGPGLASRWRTEPDGTRMTIELGEHSWHDGEDVTPEDVLFTIGALKNSKSNSQERGRLAVVSGATAPDRTTVELTFDPPVLHPERILSFKILPKHAFDGETIPIEDGFRLRPIGSGPFKYVKWQGQKLVLERAQSADQNQIPMLEARFIQDKNTQLNLIQFDGIQGIVRVMPKQVPVLKAMEGVRLHPYESLTWWYVGFNHRSRHLRKRAVRSAIVHALDRDDIRRTHLGEGQTISGPFAPRSPFYDPDIAPRRFVPQRARVLMRRAGYRRVEGYWTGKNRVKLRMVLAKKMDTYRDVCLDIQARLRRAGFGVQMVWLDDAKFEREVLRKGRFDLTIGLWTFDESSNVHSLFHSKGANNYIGYNNRRVDELLELARSTVDPDIYLDAHLELHKVTHRDLPYGFLWSARSYTAVTNELTGVEVHPYRYFTWIADWYYR